MIIGEKKNQKTDPSKYLEEVEKLKKQFGISQHYLESLV